MAQPEETRNLYIADFRASVCQRLGLVAENKGVTPFSLATRLVADGLDRLSQDQVSLGIGDVFTINKVFKCGEEPDEQILWGTSEATDQSYRNRPFDLHNQGAGSSASPEHLMASMIMLGLAVMDTNGVTRADLQRANTRVTARLGDTTVDGAFGQEDLPKLPNS